MRRLVVAGLLLAAIGLTPSVASASPDDTVNFHFTGRAGSAVLTDCPPPPSPIGTECRAVSVFAAEQRVNDDGVRAGGPFVAVTLFDVIITGGAPGFVAIPIGDGFTEEASVQITGMAKGTASAVDVPLCETFSCAPGDPRSLSVRVDWRGFGPVSESVFHDRRDGECFFYFHHTGRVRSADAVGTVDGATWTVPLAAGFIPTLEANTDGSVQRCTPG